MKVLIAAVKDYANMGNILKKCLINVGIDAKFYTEMHTIRLKKGESLNKNQAIEFGNKCDIIQFMHSNRANLPINLKRKKVIVYHGGTIYRQRSEEMCKLWNPIVDCSLIQTYDLYGLGAKNEIWLLPPIDTDKILPKYNTKGQKIIIGHYPSSPIAKGSDKIQNIIDSIRGEVPDFDYRYSSKRVNWETQIQRVSDVDIYIELMRLKQKGKQYGHWGVSGLEAAALGKIVITNFYGHKEYEKTYGLCALQVANSEKEMRKKLITLLSMSKEELLDLKVKSRRWTEKYHSYKIVGNKLRKIYEKL